MTIRSFIAIHISDDIKKALSGLVSDLKRYGADVKWVKPENIHLTLKFLGNIDENRIDSISAHLDAIGSDYSPFFFDLTGTGTFPDLRRPRVIWTGLRGYEPVLRIFKDIDTAMEKEGFDREKRPFSPHITLGRVRSLRGIDKLLKELVKYKGTGFGTQAVDSLHLMKSVLKPGGAEYSLLHSAPLRRTQ